MKYYLAYGSNLNTKQMKHRCHTAKKVGTFMLVGYELEFRIYLTIVLKKDGVVPIGVWTIDKEDELSLDRYEGYPTFYRKEEMEFSLNGRKEKGIIYIMNDVRGKGAPSGIYLKTCLEGYRDFDFDIHYLKTALINCDK